MPHLHGQADLLKALHPSHRADLQELREHPGQLLLLRLAAAVLVLLAVIPDPRHAPETHLLDQAGELAVRQGENELILGMNEAAAHGEVEQNGVHPPLH